MNTLAVNRGEFKSMSMADYRAADGISKSALDLIHRSPAHYRYNLDYPEPPTPAMMFGSMLHTLVLEPDLFFEEYAVIPQGIDRRTKEGKEQWAMWERDNQGKQGVTLEDYSVLEDMRDSLLDHSRAARLLTLGQAEQCAFWTSQRPTGPDVLCKSRFDYVRDGFVIDIKTAIDARPEAFARVCWNLRYHVQAAMYSDAYREVTGDKPDGFLLVVIEKSAPYAVAVYSVAEEMVEQGRHEYYTDLNVYAACLETDTWPSYPDEVLEIELPRWAQEGR